MTTARLEGFNNTQATRSDGLSLSIADWRESSAVNRQGRPNDQSATGEAARNIADASAITMQSTEVISAGGILYIPKQIDGVNLPMENNSQVQATPKSQEAPKEPGLTTPGSGPLPLPETTDGEPHPPACLTLPGTDPVFDPVRGWACPQPGIRSESQGQ